MLALVLHTEARARHGTVVLDTSSVLREVRLTSLVLFRFSQATTVCSGCTWFVIIEQVQARGRWQERFGRIQGAREEVWAIPRGIVLRQSRDIDWSVRVCMGFGFDVACCLNY